MRGIVRLNIRIFSQGKESRTRGHKFKVRVEELKIIIMDTTIN